MDTKLGAGSAQVRGGLSMFGAGLGSLRSPPTSLHNPPMSLPSLSPPHQDMMHYDLAGSIKVLIIENLPTFELIISGRDCLRSDLLRMWGHKLRQTLRNPRL